MDEMQNRILIRSMTDHVEAIQSLVDESRARITHPSMAGPVLKLMVEYLLSEIDHHSIQLLSDMDQIKQSLKESL
jgi:hypothetical protein